MPEPDLAPVFQRLRAILAPYADRLVPELLDGVSDALRKRMQGKSCFNFKAVDEALFAELEGLTRRGFKRYRKAGYAG